MDDADEGPGQQHPEGTVVPVVGGDPSAEQVSYWVRLGREIDWAIRLMPQVQEVVAGRAQFSTLDPAERALAHATINAHISDRAARAKFGDDL